MVTTKLISAFVFAARIVQSLYFLNAKFQASSHLLWLYSPVCVGPGRNPKTGFLTMRLIYFSIDILVGKQNSPRCDAAFCIFKPGEDSVPYISYCALKHRLWVLVRKPQLGDSQVRKSAAESYRRRLNYHGLEYCGHYFLVKVLKSCCKHSIRRVPI